MKCYHLRIASNFEAKLLCVGRYIDKNRTFLNIIFSLKNKFYFLVLVNLFSCQNVPITFRFLEVPNWKSLRYSQTVETLALPVTLYQHNGTQAASVLVSSFHLPFFQQDKFSPSVFRSLYVSIHSHSNQFPYIEKIHTGTSIRVLTSLRCLTFWFLSSLHHEMVLYTSIVATTLFLAQWNRTVSNHLFNELLLSHPFSFSLSFFSLLFYPFWFTISMWLLLVFCSFSLIPGSLVTFPSRFPSSSKIPSSSASSFPIPEHTFWLKTMSHHYSWV